jgi:hypothetical protein
MFLIWDSGAQESWSLWLGTMRSVPASDVPGRNLGAVMSPESDNSNDFASSIGSCDATPAARRFTVSRRKQDIIRKHHTAFYPGTRPDRFDRADRHVRAGAINSLSAGQKPQSHT